MRFDRYTVILLTLRPDAPAMTDDEAAELQDRHLAHGADLQDRGLVLARGPLVDQDDERFRGFSIWSVDAATARRACRGRPGGSGGTTGGRGHDLDDARREHAVLPGARTWLDCGSNCRLIAGRRVSIWRWVDRRESK